VYAPDKVDNINTIVEQFKGRKNELWARLEQKYGLEPGSALAFIQDEDEFDDDENEDDPFGFIKDPYSVPQHTAGEPTLEEQQRVMVAHQRKQARQAVQARLMRKLQQDLQQEGLTRAEQFYQVINSSYTLADEPEQEEGEDGEQEGGGADESGEAKGGEEATAAAAVEASEEGGSEQENKGGGAEGGGDGADTGEAVVSPSNSSSSSSNEPSPRNGSIRSPRSPRLPKNHPVLDGEGDHRWKYGDQMVGELVQRALLHSLAFKGIPDEAQALRPLVWRLLLGYVPLHRSQWEDELRSKRQLYTEYCGIFLKGALAKGAPGEDGADEGAKEAEEAEKAASEEEAEKKAKAAEVVDAARKVEEEAKKAAAAEARKDMSEEEREAAEEAEQEARVEELLRREREEEDARDPYTDLVFEIKKDVDRTHQDNHFFNQQSTHSSIMRILLVYASLNPGVKYVQGMNEIVAPLFYGDHSLPPLLPPIPPVFLTPSPLPLLPPLLFSTMLPTSHPPLPSRTVLCLDVDGSWKKHAEADTFYCFTNLMSEIRDHFLVSLDNADGGIKSKIHQVGDV
jgi:hypothetical protein